MRHRSAAPIPLVLNELFVAAVSMIATVRPSLRRWSMARSMAMPLSAGSMRGLGLVRRRPQFEIVPCGSASNAHTLARVHRRNCEPNGKCAFSATALLSCQDDYLHLASPFNGKSRDSKMILKCETNTFGASTRVKAIRPVLHFCCLKSFGNDFAPASAGFKKGIFQAVAGLQGCRAQSLDCAVSKRASIDACRPVRGRKAQ
jgi:hypothetical protein